MNCQSCKIKFIWHYWDCFSYDPKAEYTGDGSYSIYKVQCLPVLLNTENTTIDIEDTIISWEEWLENLNCNR